MNRLSIMAAPTALLVIAFINHPASARHHHRHHHSHRYLASAGTCKFTNDGRQQCGRSVRAQRWTRSRRSVRRYTIDANGSRVARVAGEGTIIGSRPSGCPHAYCGCGLRKYLGIADTRLNLASNWARLFPHVAGPRAGVAAVRSHHVMYIEGPAGNGQWLVRDYNSGGGLSRVHIRDVRGYTFVQPHS